MVFINKNLNKEQGKKMKLQQLSVIFIIIILPIAIVLDTYVNNLIDVSNKQKNYNTILYNSTYDAVRAYQMNTLNNSFASVNTSRDRDINATVNSFFNSLASGFSSSGYTKNDLKDYIPAMLFTLYDGYYVYGPYENNATISNNKPEFYGEGDNNTKRNIEYGVKPYNYYSCEYSNGSNYDLIVNYTLDNYISISGWYGNDKTPILAAGYYINPNKIDIDKDKNVTINNNGQTIVLQPEELSEYISTYDNYKSGDGVRKNTESTELSEARKYRYINYNEEKYYFDSYNDDVSRARRESNISYNNIPIFKLDGNLRTYINEDMLNTLQNFTGETLSSEDNFKDVNYYYYYKKAQEFSVEAEKALSLIQITRNANGKYNNVKTEYFNKNYKIITKDGDEIKYDDKSDKGNSSHIKYDYSDVDGYVFDLNKEKNDPEMEESAFNRHRMDVIISSVESALDDSITNFNKYQSSSYSYRMPTISETDWYKVANNLSIISFMQGIGVGNFKYYNNYAIVTNTKNKEFVSKNSIYVQDKTDLGDGPYLLKDTSNEKIFYHNPRCNEYNKKKYNEEKKDNNTDGVIGYRTIDYEIQSISHTYKENKVETNQTANYYMQPGTGAYECIVSYTKDTISFDDLMSLKKGTEDKGNYKNTYSLAVDKAFIQALAREKNAETKVYEIYNL